MTIKVSLAGVTGWTGEAIAQAIVASADMQLVSPVSRAAAGSALREHGVESDLQVCGTVEEALAAQPDVFIDYTSAQAIKQHAVSALHKGIPTIIGSSGLSAADFDEIEKLAIANGIGVIACGNFSITAALAKHFSLLAAEYLPSWEIIDYASATKMDAPSGTARELAEAMEKVKANKLGRQIKDVVGDSTARGAQVHGTPVHSLRLPGFVLSFETLFGLPDERLTIRHDAGTSATPYVDGTLLAVRKVKAIKGLVRGLDQLMFGKS